MPYMSYGEMKTIYHARLTPAEQKDPVILNRVDRYISADMKWQCSLLKAFSKPFSIHYIARRVFKSVDLFLKGLK